MKLGLSTSRDGGVAFGELQQDRERDFKLILKTGASRMILSCIKFDASFRRMAPPTRCLTARAFET
jgi:hypothetical protein